MSRLEYVDDRTEKGLQLKVNQKLAVGYKLVNITHSLNPMTGHEKYVAWLLKEV